MAGPADDPKSAIQSLFDSGEYEKMYDYCRRMLDDDPGDATALHNISVALIRLERYEDAIPYCDKVLEEHDKSDEHALRNKLLALEALQRHDDAMRTCRLILEADPHDVVALTGMGLALTRAGRHEDSMQYYDRALAASPDDVTALLNKGLSLAYLKRYEEALSLYDRAEQVDASLARSVSAARSKIFSKMGREDEAFLAAQGVRNRDMDRIISDARRNNCSVFHQFCNNEYSDILAEGGDE